MTVTRGTVMICSVRQASVPDRVGAAVRRAMRPGVRAAGAGLRPGSCGYLGVPGRHTCRSHGAAHDGWAREFRGLRQRGVLDLGDGEARFLEEVERRAVAVTADDEPVDPVHTVLEPSQLGVGGTHMLDEQQLAAGTQHPAQLPQCPRLIVHPAQHQRRDRYVEGVVIEG
jgi:hypothetical protein